MNENYIIFFMSEGQVSFMEVQQLKDFFSLLETTAPTDILAVFEPRTSFGIDDVYSNPLENDEFYFIYTDSNGFENVIVSHSSNDIDLIVDNIRDDLYYPLSGFEDEELEQSVFYAFSTKRSKSIDKDKVELLKLWGNYVNLRKGIKDVQDLDVLDTIVHRNLNLMSI